MLYFRGCVARLKVKEIVDATEIILKTAGIDFKYLSEEECCGSILLRTGFKEDAQNLMKKNMEKFENEKILVSCGGCYRSLKKDYKQILGVELSVIHTSQLFQELLAQDKIHLENSSKKITYHDPCHLGRHMGEYEAPRKLIQKLGDLVEMEHHHEHSRCCGSGGGVKAGYSDLSKRIASQKVKDIENTGADFVSTSCPFCKFNLKIRGLEVWDLSELILMSLEGNLNESE